MPSNVISPIRCVNSPVSTFRVSQTPLGNERKTTSSFAVKMFDFYGSYDVTVEPSSI